MLECINVLGGRVSVNVSVLQPHIDAGFELGNLELKVMISEDIVEGHEQDVHALLRDVLLKVQLDILELIKDPPVGRDEVVEVGVEVLLGLVEQDLVQFEVFLVICVINLFLHLEDGQP